MASVLENLSNELAAAAEQVGPSVVAVQARHRIGASGIQWRKGVIVTADHAIRREEDVRVLLSPEKAATATIAGRDPSTDLAVLRIEDQPGLRVPEAADTGSLNLGNLVLALGRSRRGSVVASMGIVGGIAGEFRSWRGGKLEQHVRLDLNLYPGFSGGPLVNAQGKVVGVNTSGFSRGGFSGGRPLTIPVATVNRVVEELLQKGHIARPYLGLAMQPVAIPEALRSKAKLEAETGLLVVHVEAGGPADKAGVLLGDVLTAVQGEPLEELESIQDALVSAKVGEKISASAIRAGAPVEISVTLGDRPHR